MRSHLLTAVDIDKWHKYQKKRGLVMRHYVSYPDVRRLIVLVNQQEREKNIF
jgi:hypothetical protein